MRESHPEHPAHRCWHRLPREFLRSPVRSGPAVIPGAPEVGRAAWSQALKRPLRTLRMRNAQGHRVAGDVLGHRDQLGAPQGESPGERLEVQIQPAQEAPVFPRLGDDRASHHHRRVQLGVAVPANDQVQPGNAAGQFLVVPGAQVRKEDDRAGAFGAYLGDESGQDGRGVQRGESKEGVAGPWARSCRSRPPWRRPGSGWRRAPDRPPGARWPDPAGWRPEAAGRSAAPGPSLPGVRSEPRWRCRRRPGHSRRRAARRRRRCPWSCCFPAAWGPPRHRPASHSRQSPPGAADWSRIRRASVAMRANWSTRPWISLVCRMVRVVKASPRGALPGL